MKGYMARRVSLVTLAVVALSPLCFSETAARAQGAVHAFQIISAGKNVGLTRGQTLRYTWVNLNDPDPRQGDLELLGFQVKVLSASGLVVAEAKAPAMGTGTSQSFDFIRDEIDLPGEPGTGRLQLRLEVAVEYARAHTSEGFVTTQQILDAFDDAAEVIDTLTGRTTVSFKPKEIVVVGSKPSSAPVPGEQDLVWIDLGSPVGIAPEQTLRISVFNPLPPAPAGADGRKYKMLFAPLILDLDGQAIARKDEIALDPGQSHSFDFTRAELPLAGEPGTGRVQVRSEIRRRFFHGIVSPISQGNLHDFPGTLELVDQGTGKTVMLLPAVQAARAARSRQQ